MHIAHAHISQPGPPSSVLNPPPHPTHILSLIAARTYLDEGKRWAGADLSAQQGKVDQALHISHPHHSWRALTLPELNAGRCLQEERTRTS